MTSRNRKEFLSHFFVSHFYHILKAINRKRIRKAFKECYRAFLGVFSFSATILYPYIDTIYVYAKPLRSCRDKEKIEKENFLFFPCVKYVFIFEKENICDSMLEGRNVCESWYLWQKRSLRLLIEIFKFQSIGNNIR